jgi:hypothetical protein
MRFSMFRFAAFGVVLAAACGSSKGGTSSGDSASDGGSSSGGSSGSSGGSGGSSSGPGSSSGAVSSDAGDSGAFPPAGNPDGSCKTLPLPSQGQLVDTSKPTTVVGTGTAASCTFDALNAAVTKGGIITFDCGPSPVTIPVTATLEPPVSNGSTPLSVVIDGGDEVTLDGQNAVRILSWVHDSWRTSQDTLTFQRIRLVNGKTTPTEKIPACPPANGISNTACSTGYDDGQGGAVYMQDGILVVIDSIFEHNQAALLGPDTGGGAIYIFGSGYPAYLVHSSFLNNTASNAGGVGMLASGAFIFDSLFEGNTAVGTGANNNDATQCTCNNGNDKNQIGSGGNGGAIYSDGNALNVTICGTEIKDNTANEFGPAVFMTNDGRAGQLILDDSTITGNSTPISYWQWCTDVSTDYPHAPDGGAGSPSPINTSFCNASGQACTGTCSS